MKWRITKNIAKAGAAVLFFLSIVGVVFIASLEDAPQVRPPLQLEFEFKTDQPAQCVLVADGMRAVNFGLLGQSDFTPAAGVIPEGPEPLTSIRLDPLQQPGEVTLRNFRITRGGVILKIITPANIESLNPRASVELAEDGIRVIRNENEDYPALLFKNIYPVDTAVFTGPRFTRLALDGIWALGIFFTILAVAQAVRSLKSSPLKYRLGFAGLLLFIFGARLLTLQHYGFSTPFWDYWQMPWTVYLPFEDGTLTWRAMFAPVNEHRIFFARVFSLGLFLLNGQWDNLYEAVAMSAMYSLAGAGLALMVWNSLGRRFFAPVAAAAAGVFALPFSWENTVWANQSQFYFFIVFSALSLWLLAMHRPFSSRWWMGCSAAVAALFTVGSGVTASAAVAGLMIYRLLRERMQRRDALFTVAAAAVPLGLWLLTRVKSQSYGMLTQTASQFFSTFGKTMSWPFVESRWLWPLLWLPLVWMMVMAFRRREPLSKAELWAVGLGGWALLNALGTAVFRGRFGAGPASRYMDITAIAFFANALALCVLAEHCAEIPKARSRLKAAAAAWAAVMAGGILAVTNTELLTNAAARNARQARARQNVLHFLRTDDIRFLLSKQEEELPHPDRLALATYLCCDRIREILPASIRMPMPVEPDVVSGFVSPGILPAFAVDLYEPVWGSYGERGDLTQGVFRSKPLPAPRYPYLEFMVLGGFDKYDKTVALALLEPGGGKRISVRPRREPHVWTQATAKVPKKPLVIEAKDMDSITWIAFKAPREKSSFSTAAERLVSAGIFVLTAGLLLLVLVAWPQAFPAAMAQSQTQPAQDLKPSGRAADNRRGKAVSPASSTKR